MSEDDKNARSEWSKETMQSTIRIFEDLSFAFNPSGVVRMKHCEERYGGIKVEDAINGRIVIHVDNDERPEIYSSIESAVDAGWVVD